MRHPNYSNDEVWEKLKADTFQNATQDMSTVHFAGLRLLINDFKVTARPETRQRKRAARRVVASIGVAAMTLGVIGPVLAVVNTEGKRKDRTVAAVRTALSSPDALKATATCAEDIEKHIKEITPTVAPRTFVQPLEVPLPIIAMLPI